MPTANDLKELGIKQFMEQDYEEAAETFRKAIAAYEADGVADMAAEMKVNLGLALHSNGDSEAALEPMGDAYDTFSEIQDKHRLAQVLGNMARIYAKLDNSEQALTNYREASAMFQEVGDEENYGQTLLAIADLHMRSGNAMLAASVFEMGLEHIKHPTARQKMMKQLMKVRGRIEGRASDDSDKIIDGEAKE
ncbi:MAG TPA: tetratricopeptide repeat protein [Aggregatilinea sp.]|jgi:tetratricopeptide (TPR) repeat protein|uniref:tetratricopeptide repeat protein n=1 Tax=Aggregatilinea sp. TaxID=2806333 RepID=UPI002CDD7109|nr:tetratricopeptide repeat protein [Aggregatilinea sp.]HML21723.1 tetratricopeptide repeat protein [Aggregatilinea sp.]